MSRMYLSKGEGQRGAGRGEQENMSDDFRNALIAGGLAFSALAAGGLALVFTSSSGQKRDHKAVPRKRALAPKMTQMFPIEKAESQLYHPSYCDTHKQ